MPIDKALYIVVFQPFSVEKYSEHQVKRIENIKCKVLSCKKNDYFRGIDKYFHILRHSMYIQCHWVRFYIVIFRVGEDMLMSANNLCHVM